MKIAVIGATGTIGKAVVKELSEHEVIKIGFNDGDYKTNIEDKASLTALFEEIGKVDAIISTTGMVAFAMVDSLTSEQIKSSINSKLIGNINLFQVGSKYLNQGGSITLPSGVLSQKPMPSGSVASLINAALDSFVKAAAFELGDSLRINTVSPHFVKETMELMGMDSSSGISAADTAKAFRHAVSTNETGQVFDVVDYI